MATSNSTDFEPNVAEFVEEAFERCGLELRTGYDLKTARRSIKQRLSDHFGGVKLSYQGSQFRKFIFQICQNDDVVKSILWSKNTLIACVPVPEQDEVIDIVEKIAMQVFQPRFNIKDR